MSDKTTDLGKIITDGASTDYGVIADPRIRTAGTNQSTSTPCLSDLPAPHIRVAIEWLIWDRGMTTEEAKETMDKWPDHSRASEAVDVATFVMEVCHGRRS